MNTKKRLFASALFIALAAAGVLISGSHNVAKAGPGAAPVSIVSPLPLPTTGTATVSGTVGATQSGTWNVGITGAPNVSVANVPTVNITGTPTVTVGNALDSPVPTLDKERLARIPYQTEAGFTCTAAACSASVGGAPAGYRLVIENVNAFLAVAPGTATGVTEAPILEIGHGFTLTWNFVAKLGPTVPGGLVWTSVNEKVVMYFDHADGQPFARAVGNFGAGGGGYVAISGYLENCTVTGCPGGV